ncbi:MAG: hypothetical protein R3E32_29010 [Chitinophagales bacterium]
MKKLPLLTLFFALFIGTILCSNLAYTSSIPSNINTFSTNIYGIESPTPETEVWVCRGKYATKYHLNNNCQGLNRCKSIIEKISKESAAQDDYCSPCGYCAKYKSSLCK